MIDTDVRYSIGHIPNKNSRSMLYFFNKKYAWYPRKTISGKWIWRKSYVKILKVRYHLEFTITEKIILTDQEFLLWRIKNDDVSIPNEI